MSPAFYLALGIGTLLMLGVGVFAAIQGLRHIAQQGNKHDS